MQPRGMTAVAAGSAKPVEGGLPPLSPKANDTVQKIANGIKEDMMVGILGVLENAASACAEVCFQRMVSLHEHVNAVFEEEPYELFFEKGWEDRWPHISPQSMHRSPASFDSGDGGVAMAAMYESDLQDSASPATQALRTRRQVPTAPSVKDLESLLTVACFFSSKLEKQATVEQAVAEQVAAEEVAAELVAAESAAVELAAVALSAVEKVAAEHAEAERAVAGQAEAVKVTTDQAAVEQAAEEKTAAEQVKVEKVAVEQAAAEQAAAEEVAAELVAAETAAVELAAVELSAVEKTAAEHAAAEKAVAEQAESVKVTTDQAAVEQAADEKTAAEQVDVENVAAEQVSAEQAAAEEATASITQIQAAEAAAVPPPLPPQRPGVWDRPETCLSSRQQRVKKFPVCRRVKGCTPGDDHVREENSSSGYDKSSLAAVQIEPEQESVHTQHVADLDVARNPQLRRELSQNLRKVRTSIDANAAVGSVLNEVRSRADEELCDQDWSASSNRHVDSGNWRKVRDGVDANAAFGSLLNEVRSRADEQMYDQDWNLGLEKGPSPPAPPQLQEEVSAIDCDESADDDTGTIQSVCTATRTKWDKVRAGVHAGAAFGSLLNEVRSREDEQLYDRDWSSGSRRSSRWSTVRASVHANAALCSALSDARSREDEQLYEQDWTCVAHNPIPREDSNASVGDHKLSL